jgi:hypothetical protein
MTPDAPYPRNTRVYRFGDAERAPASAADAPAAVEPEFVTEVPLALDAARRADAPAPAPVPAEAPTPRASSKPDPGSGPTGAWLLAGAAIGLLGDAVLRRRRRAPRPVARR